jgi:hypothetical protein
MEITDSNRDKPNWRLTTVQPSRIIGRSSKEKKLWLIPLFDSSETVDSLSSDLPPFLICIAVEIKEADRQVVICRSASLISRIKVFLPMGARMAIAYPIP